MGRHPLGSRAMTGLERLHRHRAKRRAAKAATMVAPMMPAPPPLSPPAGDGSCSVCRKAPSRLRPVIDIRVVIGSESQTVFLCGECAGECVRKAKTRLMMAQPE
jgi:hypothetical protein